MKNDALVTQKEALPAGEDATLEVASSHFMTREETREILTPFAFELDKKLFGLPLAAPWRRGIALTIDMLLIAILSSAPGEWLAIVIAITAYRLGSKKRAEKMGKVKGKKRRVLMRLTGAFILFVVLISTLPSWINQYAYEETSEQLNSNNVVVASNEFDLATTIGVAKVIGDVAELTKNNTCHNVSCWRTELSPIIADILKLNTKVKLPEEQLTELLESIVEQTELNKREQQLLLTQLTEDFNSNQPVLAAEQSSATKNIVDVESIKHEELETLNSPSVMKSEDTVPKKVTKPVYSIVELAKGIIDDLGLGFGWAAFYFTVFTALWKGQTPGKKLLKIQVLQLDGTPLSMWDSFGRYGGYGAGVATGLLGFIQIYWDPNRQAIHDKISATVVIDKVNEEKDRVDETN